ncbi:MAG TPA: citrate synthase 2 [Gaiellaceae bacterium]|jgi:citrate synthase|nr:citrate synthase 2 [Gaiellaceae bacterium]
MSTSEYSPGLAGVIAFETEIAEPDREGGSLRYRGVDIEELVGQVPFEQVWGLLVDESLEPGLPAAHCELDVRTGGPMSDLQAMLAILGGRWNLGQLIDIDDDTAKEDLRRLSAAALSIVAQSARGPDRPPVPEATVLEGETAAERFLLAWRGEVDERHAKAIDTYWICTAEHGLNASTFTARVVASTGADCGAALSAAVGALSGPLHGGAPARVLPMLDAVAALGDAERWVEQALARKERIMGFGHRVYRAEDPRSRLLKRTAKELGSPRVEVAEALERAAHEAIAKKHPDHSYTNVEFWSAIVLDVAQVPPALAPAMFACSRTAGWSAHVLEQKRLGVLVRPSARYVGPGARSLQSI